MRMRYLMAMAVLAVALSGCTARGQAEGDAEGRGDDWETPQSSAPPTSTSTQPVKDIPAPCSLLAPDVVGEIYGGEPATVDWEESPIPGASLQCVYTTEASAFTFFILDTSKLPLAPKTAAEALDLASGGNDLVMLEGIGDLAAYKDGALATLYVVSSKGASFEVTLITGSPEERDQLIKVAGELASGR